MYGARETTRVENRSGLTSGLIVVVLWASAFPGIQVAVPELGVVGLSFVRLGSASVVLIAAWLVRSRRLPERADLGWIAAAGLFGMTAYQLLLNGAELSVPAGTASIIVAAAPLVSVVTAWLLFRERIHVMTLAGGAIALAGVVAVSLARAGISLSAAVWIAVAAMVVQGIYHPLQRPLVRRYTHLEVATFTMVAGTMMTVPLLPAGWNRLMQSDPAGWMAAIYLGLLPSALGFVLWAYAARHLSVAVSTSLLYFVPAVAVVVAWIWLGEVPLGTEVIGGVVVIAGVLLISQGPRLSRLSRRRTLSA